MEVGAIAVNIGVIDGSVKGTAAGVGVDKTCTEKVHPALKSAMTTKVVIDPNQLRCFITDSLSKVVSNMEPDETFAKGIGLELDLNYYKTLASRF